MYICIWMPMYSTYPVAPSYQLLDPFYPHLAAAIIFRTSSARSFGAGSPAVSFDGNLRLKMGKST